MNPEEQLMYVAIVFQSFTENEIEHLEDYAVWGFDAVERGVRLDTSGKLILEQLEDFDDGRGSE